jgi:hypothetical protein
MARLAVISFGALVLALAALAGLDAFTAPHLPQARPGASVDPRESGAHASTTADCGGGLRAAN